VENIEDLIRRSPTLFIECQGYLEGGFPKESLFFKFVGLFGKQLEWIFPSPLFCFQRINRALILLP
jgi:hypothetical protein